MSERISSHLCSMQLLTIKFQTLFGGMSQINLVTSILQNLTYREDISGSYSINNKLDTGNITTQVFAEYL
jgi:hypothetical protein